MALHTLSLFGDEHPLQSKHQSLWFYAEYQAYFHVLNVESYLQIAEQQIDLKKNQAKDPVFLTVSVLLFRNSEKIGINSNDLNAMHCGWRKYLCNDK